jgi:hypothetical protein
MAATVIAFPSQRVFRSPHLIEALEGVRRCEAQIASGEFIAGKMGEALLPYWEGEVARLLKEAPQHLMRDGIDSVAADGRRWERM